MDELVKEIKKAADIRNAICHGSWRKPDKKGYSELFYINRKMEKFDSLINIEYLKNLQMHAACLAIEVINSISSMGLQFPGFNGPGKPICPVNE